MPIQLGGLGFIHYNMKLEEQVAQAQRVKKHVPGFVLTPSTLAENNTIADFEQTKVATSAWKLFCRRTRLRAQQIKSTLGCCCVGSERGAVRVHYIGWQTWQQASGRGHIQRHRVCQRQIHHPRGGHDKVGVRGCRLCCLISCRKMP